jgi:hypothetical protein
MARFLTAIVARRVFLALAMLALAVQIAAAAVVPWRAFVAAADDGLIAASICQAPAGAAGGHEKPAHHDPRDCALCPFCRALTQAAVPPSPPVPVALPIIPREARVMPPPARAPPSRPVAFAFPRGPPIPV